MNEEEERRNREQHFIATQLPILSIEPQHNAKYRFTLKFRSVLQTPIARETEKHFI